MAFEFTSVPCDFIRLVVLFVDLSASLHVERSASSTQFTIILCCAFAFTVSYCL